MATIEPLVESHTLTLPDAASAAIAEMVERLQPSVVQVQSGGRGGGTGVIWRANGSIITNYHVVGNATAIKVALFDGQTFDATVSARNPTLDLAVLDIAATNLPAAPVDDSARLRVGELVFAIGHPWGQRWVVTAGIVSGLGSVSVAGSDRKAQYVRSDVGLAPGNSGGPLLNARGAVVGINAMIFGGDLAVSIPSHVARTWVAGLPSRRVVLGLQIQAVELPSAFRQETTGRVRGLMVVGVNPNGPADRAAVLVGDVLLDVGDTPVSDTGTLLEALTRHDATDTVQLNILRGGVLKHVHVDVGPVERQA